MKAVWVLSNSISPARGPLVASTLPIQGIITQLSLNVHRCTSARQDAAIVRAVGPRRADPSQTFFPSTPGHCSHTHRASGIVFVGCVPPFISVQEVVLAMTVGAYEEYRGSVFADADVSSFKFISHDL